MTSQTTLRRGFTTGACAAAAAKAATRMLVHGQASESVGLDLPNGEQVTLPIHRCTRERSHAIASVIKDAGDDPDVTDGAEIVAEVQFAEGDDVQFRGGEGVGQVTKPGLQVPVGEPAINPVPREMIREAVRHETNRGVVVTVSVPDGERLATKTFNPRLGVVGGISIIGTTGRVEPKSDEAMKRSLVCALDVARAQGLERVALCPGNIGEKAVMNHLRLSREEVVQTSNFIGFMLREAAVRGFSEILLAGHPGKLVKLSAGHFDTHSARSPSALPIVAEVVRAFGADTSVLRRVEATETVEGVIQALDEGLSKFVFTALCERIATAVEQHISGAARVTVLLYAMDGRVLAWSARAARRAEGGRG